MSWRGTTSSSRITEEKEWNLLLVNLRAHNESGGDVSTLGVLERYDCRDWANWVDFEFGEQVPIFLMGISMGGAVAVMSSDLELPESVCGIIDDAGFICRMKKACTSRKTLRRRISVPMQRGNDTTELWLH